MLFFISFIMVFLSSYFIACLLSPKIDNKIKKGPAPFLYFILTIFAQIVLSIETLSIFKAINQPNLLLINFLFFVSTLSIWIKKGCISYIPDIKSFFQKVFKALKRDKILMLMAFGFIFMIVITIFLNIYMPVYNSDAMGYHLNRASYWMFQGSLEHFVISDDRNLVMPINSEILYLWSLLFFKADYGLYFVTFWGYLVSIFCIFNILEYFRFSKRRILWTIFILSSFSSVIIEISSVETDVLIAGLVLSSITLFLFSLKKDDNIMISFSALAYALAIGTKSPAIMAFPSVFLLFIYLAYKTHNKEFYKPLLKFLGLLCITFLFVGSYNYFQNLISFGHPLGSESSLKIHGFRGGFKAFVANYIRYIFMMFDFSGFKYSEYIGEYILQARESILTFLNIPLDWGVEMSDYNIINNRLMSVKAGAGILGFLLFLPSLFTMFILKCFSKNNKYVNILFIFSIMFFVNLACLSFSIAYMVFSIRFITFFILLSAPVLAISYFKRTSIIKLLILFYSLSYFSIISINLSGKQLKDIFKIYNITKSIDKTRECIRCSSLVGYEGYIPLCHLRDYIQTNIPKGSKIALFLDAVDKSYIINMMNAKGYKIDTLLPENAQNINYNNYDYAITTRDVLSSTLLLNKTKEINTEYKINKDGNVYFPSNPSFSCVYQMQNGDFFVSKKSKGIVIASSCNISKRFFEEKGFIPEIVVKFNAEQPEDQAFISIYKNMNKQN